MGVEHLGSGNLVDVGQAWLAGCVGYRSPLFRSIIMSLGQGLAYLGTQAPGDGS